MYSGNTADFDSGIATCLYCICGSIALHNHPYSISGKGRNTTFIPPLTFAMDSIYIYICIYKGIHLLVLHKKGAGTHTHTQIQACIFPQQRILIIIPFFDTGV